MPPAVPRHQALRDLASDPSAQATIAAQAGPMPDDVRAWLADLQTLAGIPFCYLVPDARMLPPESIRFFAVDPNWTAALADGVLSLAAKTAPAAAAVRTLRPATATSTTYSGFLLRSALVSGWPGLRVAGFADAQGTTALPVARLDRPAPTVLLALFSGLIQRAELTEPTQHLHFGVTVEATVTVPLRWIDQGQAGVPLSDTAQVAFRQDPGRQVIDIAATVTAITTKLARAYGTTPVPHLGSAALSLQFVQSTVTQPFSTAVTSS